MTIEDLKREAMETIYSFPFVSKVEIIDEDRSAIKLRLFIRPNFYIQAFFNTDTETTNYAVILNDRRLFGRDISNAKGWHMHPFDEPDNHDFSDDGKRPVTLTEFLYEFQKIAFDQGLI